MKLIETKTLTGTQASIEFTSIPSTFTDLVAVCSLRATGVSDGSQVYLEINGSASSFTNRTLYGTGASALSFSGTIGYAGFYSGSGDTANTFGNNIVYIPNYTGSTNKSISIDTVYETNATSAYQGIQAQLWANTAAITSLLFKPTPSASWVAGSIISLYGILKGSDGIVTTS
jgi:hypothetical protein